MTEKLIVAVTPTNAPYYPPYLNVTDCGDGTVRVTLRASPEPKTGSRLCGFGPRDPNYMVDRSCWAGGPGCNNYCNMHPDRRTKERPDGLPMADLPEPCAWIKCGETIAAVLPKADWDDFVRRAAAEMGA